MSSDSSFFLSTTTQNLPNAQTPTSSSSSQWGQGGPYNGTTSIAFMDELIKEYLLFRGFNATIKSFEHDLKQDKDRSFRADKITDQIFAYIHAYDLNGLLDYWSYLDHKFFSKITLKLSVGSSAALSRKYELFLLRYYLINAIQASKTEKAIEFFENYASKLQAQSEWKEWYCLPFLKNPEENSVFSVYFNKNWISSFIISLQNFLNIVFQSVTFPRLLNYDEDSFWNKQIYQKNQTNNAFTANYFNFELDYLQTELVDEFQLLQVDQQNRQPNNSFISLIKNLTAYPTKLSSSSSSKTSTSAGNMIISTNTSNSMAAEALNQNVAKILATKTSAFDYMVKNRVIASHKKSLNATVNSSDGSKVTEKADLVSSTIGALVSQNLPISPQPPGPTSIISQTQYSPPSTQSQGAAGANATATLSNKLDIKAEILAAEVDDSFHRNLVDKTVKESLERGQERGSKTAEPYLLLSQEDYTEHKSAILHCKFSKDGKYVASVDCNSLIKIWSFENALNTVSTIMQKSSILTIEWDKRFANILYIGTKSYSVKTYDIYQKRIIQDLAFNKMYPFVTSINTLDTLPPNEKVLILMASKTVQITNSKSTQREIRNGQMAICNLNSLNFNLTIEKLVDLDLFFSQCLVSYRSLLSVIMGCSDGSIRVYDLKNHAFALNEKCNHASSILNLTTNKSENIILSLSIDCVKMWNLIDSNEEATNRVRFTLINEIKLNGNIPFFTYEQLIASSSLADLANLVDLRLTNATSVIRFDSTENYLYILDKNGVDLRDVHVVAGGGDQVLGKNFSKRFDLEQATTLEIWNANHLCILIAGSQNGTLRIYKLLHQS